MSDETPTMTAAADEELLGWENLGAVPAGRAFRRGLIELLRRPGRFFGRMAVSGGLHEPLTFFALVLGAGVVLAFLAALSYLGVSAPDPERLSAAEYARLTLPARASGLLLALLPLALGVGGAAMVVLGTLFHLPGRVFGAGRWEGSVSVWLYSASAALAPTVLALAGIFAVSLAGYLVGLKWPQAAGAVAHVARWTWVILLSAGIVGGLIALLACTTVGCTRAFGLDASLGTAAALAGLLLIGALGCACAWGFLRGAFRGGLIAVGACTAAAVALTVLSVIRARRREAKDLAH
jgi:hypothetical protein